MCIILRLFSRICMHIDVSTIQQHKHDVYTLEGLLMREEKRGYVYVFAWPVSRDLEIFAELRKGPNYGVIGMSLLVVS